MSVPFVKYFIGAKATLSSPEHLSAIHRENIYIYKLYLFHLFPFSLYLCSSIVTLKTSIAEFLENCLFPFLRAAYESPHQHCVLCNDWKYIVTCNKVPVSVQFHVVTFTDFRLTEAVIGTPAVCEGYRKSLSHSRTMKTT